MLLDYLKKLSKSTTKFKSVIISFQSWFGEVSYEGEINIHF